MKKRDLIFAAALLLGFSLGARAQTAEETLFFYGFEDELASFRDSTAVVDSITQIRYYAGNPNSSGFEIVYTKDSLMYMFNAITTVRSQSRTDSYELVTDPIGVHEAELTGLGGQGGRHYLKFTSGGEGSDLCNDYQANLFVRGLKLEPFTSYRLVFYSKGSHPEANLQAGVFRGYYNSEKSISLNGGSGNEFRLEKTEFTTDRWERNTLMMFYQNDSVANAHMYNAGYWWTNSWATTDTVTGKSYNQIEQFDKYFMRMSFRYPGRTYYIDDISLYKSTIGGAEFNGDVLRVNFGYQTNLAELAKKDPTGALELPGEYFRLVSHSPTYGDEELPVLSAEYHADGYLYIWLDGAEFYPEDDTRLSFTNPVDDPNLCLKYTGRLFPYSLDTAWVNAGKIVPDFENEFAVFNPAVSAISRVYLAPTVKISAPENGSFNLDPKTRSIDISFSKEIYTNLTAGTADVYNVIVAMQSSGAEEIWLPTDYNEETFTVTFTRPAKFTADLSGDCDFKVRNARAGKGEMYQVGSEETITLTFGDLSAIGRPVYFYQSEAETAWRDPSNAHQSIPKGWTAIDNSIGSAGQIGTGEAVSGRSRMMRFAAGGVFTRGHYLAPRGTTIDAALRYGVVEGYDLSLDQGEYWLSFKMFGWDGTPNIRVFVYPVGADRPSTPLGTFKAEPSVASGTAITGTYQPTQAASVKVAFTVENDDNYIIEFTSAKSQNYSGAVIGAIELTNQYSEAFTYLKMLEDAQAAANGVLASAQADNKYSGEYLNTFQGVIDDYADFTHTAPSAYVDATNTIKDATTAMSTRMTTVDKFYSEYQAAVNKEAVYTDSVGYNELVAYTALVAKIAEYDGLDVTVKDNAELTAITAEVTAATKAMTDRCTAIDNFNKALADALNVLENQTEYDMLPEYAALQSAYNEWKDLNVITSSDEDLAESTGALNDARKFYTYAGQSIAAQTVQVKGLYALATELEVDFDDIQAGLADEIADRMNNLRTDDQDLAALLKEVLKYRVYELLADEGYDGTRLNLTPFITNYNMYLTAKIGVEVEQFYYNWGAPNDRWRLKSGVFTTVYPGWTLNGKSGNVHVCNETQNWNDKAEIVDGYIAFDWNSSFELGQTVTGLPEGLYSIGVGFNNNLENSIMIGQADDNTPDTVSVAKGSQDYPAAANAFVDSLEVSDAITVKLVISGGSSWGRIDNWELYLDGKSETADYAALAAAQKQAAIEQATFVPSIRTTAPVSYRYFTVDGVETDASNNGILIRVSTGADGRRTVEKVIVR